MGMEEGEEMHTVGWGVGKVCTVLVLYGKGVQKIKIINGKQKE